MRAAAIAGKQSRLVVAVAASFGAGALDPGCKHGPAAFRRHWDRDANSRQARLVWQLMPEGLDTGTTPIDAVASSARWLAETTRALTASGQRVLVIGGDHSCAVGTWSGVSEALRPSGPLGLIWIDAHMDMHTPATTHSGAINGMPIAALLGHGAPPLTGIAGGQRAIDPGRICLVGARSFEPEELEFSKMHGVRVIHMAEVQRRGIRDALAEARTIAGAGTAGYGVSLDLDAFDPVDAPGVGTPEPGGIHVDEFLGLWTELARSPGCRGVEIVEFNPSRDRDGRTLRLLDTLVGAMIGEERMRWAG